MALGDQLEDPSAVQVTLGDQWENKWSPSGAGRFQGSAQEASKRAKLGPGSVQEAPRNHEKEAHRFQVVSHLASQASCFAAQISCMSVFEMS